MNILQALRIVFIFCLSFFAAIGLFAEGLSENYQRGIQYKNAGQYQKAIVSFDLFINSAKADSDKNLLADTHYQIASTYHVLEEYNKSIESYKEAIVLNPNSALYYNALGISYSELKQYKAAIAAYEKAIEITPKNAQPYYNLGLVYLKQGVFTFAVTAFKNAIAVDADWSDAYIGLGEIYLKQGDFENAEKAYLNAAHFNPSGMGILSGLGQVYAKQKRYDLAIDTFDKVLSLESDNTEAHYQLAQVYHKRGDREKAASRMEFFKLLRNTDPILEKARKWVKINPDDPIGYNNLGIIYLTRKRYEKAIEFYSHAIDLSPNLPTTHYNLGLTYHKQGKLDLAIKAYQQAITLDPTLAIAHNNLAVCYTDLKQNLEKALLHAKTATDLNPNDANYWDTLATVYTQLGLDNQAQIARQKQISLLNSPEK